MNKKSLFFYVSLLCFVIVFLFVLLWSMGFRLGKVETNSMSPAINIGDLVVYRLGVPLKVGGIAAFDREGIVVIHRVVQKFNWGVMVKGDNASGTEIVKNEQILGCVLYCGDNFKILLWILGLTIVLAAVLLPLLSNLTKK